MAGFGFAGTTDEMVAGRDLPGKTALITGAASGIGRETAAAEINEALRIEDFLVETFPGCTSPRARVLKMTIRLQERRS